MNKAMHILGIIIIALSVLLLIAVPPIGVIGIIFGVLLIIKSKKELVAKISSNIENAKEEAKQRSEILKQRLEKIKQKESDNKITFNIDVK
jgi:beta-lactamase regulating signal transducer with metallopeptidase domain